MNHFNPQISEGGDSMEPPTRRTQFVALPGLGLYANRP